MRNFTVKLVLVLFAIGLATISFELLLRAVVPPPENLAKLKSSSNFLYENKPNAQFSYSSNDEFANVISINSYGFRDDEFSTIKKAQTLRIAVLGDSQEEALQVKLSDTWQKVMARKISETLGRKVESYNFGVSGYGTDQEWLTLSEKVWQFAPDMIILAFSPNDVGDTYKNKLVRLSDNQLTVVSSGQRAGGNWLGKIVRGTYSYHLTIRAASRNKLTKALVDKLRTKLLGFPKEERFFLSDAQLVQGPFEVIASQKNPPLEVTNTWEVIKALILDMEKQAENHGSKFLITVNVPRAQVLPSDWEYLRDTYHLDAASSSPYEINQMIAEIAKDVGVLFYDPRVDAIEWIKSFGILHYPKDGHFNKNGNLFMGTKVAEFILSEKTTGFIP